MTAPSLLLEAWPVVLRIARLVYRFRGPPPSPAAMQQFETELAGLLCELGRRIVQWTLNHHQAQVEQVLGWLAQAAAEDGPRRIVLAAGRAQRDAAHPPAQQV